VRLLRAWLDQSGITKGPLFRRIDSRTGAIGGVALTPQSIALVIKSAVERAGLDPEPFGGHSLRAGFATSAAAAGKSLHDIMRQTRHRSERIAMTYTRQPARRHAREEYLFEDNPADGID
jgi:integrase